MHAYLAEFIGTALLILLGNGVVANVVLARTKGNGGGWIVIAAGWGIAVFVGAFCSQEFSGAHLNPAVTLAMTMAGQLSAVDTVGYMACQMGGAMLGALLVYVFYREHFLVTDSPDDRLACFCTAPNIRNLGQSFVCEAIGTYVLILPIFLMVSPSIRLSEAADDLPTLGLGTIGLLPVGLLVFGIGLSLGGTTGYAINPARDLGPRLVHAMLPIAGKRDSDWGYAWVPVLGPLAGGALAALSFRLLVSTTNP
ncbi:MAG: MIP/aquaporin family protein [Planctomycetaceae bacterium]